MAFAITQTCCADATCVSVCPVNCIHPTPEERAFGSTEMLYIDPRSCIDCGACADACPVDAVRPVLSLTGPEEAYATINADYFEGTEPTTRTPGSPNLHDWGAPRFDRVLGADFPRLRVAIVGSGPAGMYAAEDLILHADAEVTVLDRLPVTDGLIRFGVAPDHPATKQVAENFHRLHQHPRVRLALGVEVGTDVTHEQLLEHHDAVIYAVGAPSDRRLGVPGEDLPGSLPATTVVGWYNGHPDVAADAVDLDTERVVVVGTGNVALDVARVLLSDPDTLAGTTIAPHALAALRTSKVHEVVLLARRGPEDAAWTRPELLALRHLPGVELVVDDHAEEVGATIDAAERGRKAATLQGVARRGIDWSLPPAPGRRIVVRFLATPVEVTGDEETRGIVVSDGARRTEIAAARVIRAIGHRGQRVADLPWDGATATVPHHEGRVDSLPGAYVAGWIKRGPSGGIGTNRRCATETVGTLFDDVITGRISTGAVRRRGLKRLLARAQR
ncbi:FAD-dependent oxidoreductase [Nocardioides sp. Bht2]|uniref:FAD-dependent oxidoreductase n=1 Tax=Nocardioides sp. Bht2 TaxID=3392297 RepID=UPI0039B42915